MKLKEYIKFPMNPEKRNFTLHELARCVGFFNKKQFTKYLGYCGMASIINVLDVIAIGLISVGSSKVITKFNILENNSPETSGISALNSADDINQIYYLFGMALILLFLKTAISMFTLKKVFNFLSSKSAEISEDLFRGTFSKPLDFLRKLTPQGALFAVTQGADAITLSILGSLVTIISDIFLLGIVMLTLFKISVSMALTSTAYFTLVSVGLYFVLNSKARHLGDESRELTISINRNTLENFHHFREIVVTNQVNRSASNFSASRKQSAKVHSEIIFLPYIGKYVLENSIILGSVVILGAQLWLNDAKAAFVSMSVFLVASTRIVPAILRLQQSSIQIQNAFGIAKTCIDLSMEIGKFDSTPNVGRDTYQFCPEIKISNVSYEFLENQTIFFNNISLEIRAGERVAIVGPSGGGKSTLLDLLLGIVAPKEGQILISGVEPRFAYECWPSSVAYVPQIPVILTGSVRENLAIDNDRNIEKQDEEVELLLSNLGFTLDFSPAKGILDSYLGTFGEKLSGGQKQKLALARALIRKPKLIVLDEFSSNLDSKSEDDALRVLENVSTDTTVLIAAHKRSTIKSCDRILFIENGKIVELTKETYFNLD